MTDIDIVAELRAGEDDPYIPHRTGEVMRHAADEIERLRGEGGWEYALQADGDDEPWSDYSNDPEWLFSEAGSCISSTDRLVRRRAAGPWERVEGEGDA